MELSTSPPPPPSVIWVPRCRPSHQNSSLSTLHMPGRALIEHAAARGLCVLSSDQICPACCVIEGTWSPGQPSVPLPSLPSQGMLVWYGKMAGAMLLWGVGGRDASGRGNLGTSGAETPQEKRV